jgi:hypothetical protein
MVNRRITLAICFFWNYGGIPRFQLLQKWQKRLTAPLAYYVFDLLWTEGTDLTSERVLERRRATNSDRLGGFGRPNGRLCGRGHGKELFPSGKGEKDGGDCGTSAKTACINPEGGPPIGWKISHLLDKDASNAVGGT